jgi:hypothetical protein
MRIGIVLMPMRLSNCAVIFKNLFVLRLVSELDWQEPDLLMVVTLLTGLALSRYLRGYCWYLLTDLSDM